MSSGPVGDLAAAVAARRVTAVVAVTEAVRRIEDLDGPLNAVVELRIDDALAEASAYDDGLASGAVAPGPLAGVPVLVKDLEDVTGMPTRKGSRLLNDAPPASADGLTPARLRAAGAIVVGKSTLPEFATEGHTWSPLTGATHNPWHLDRSPGGSSGGSAAALAAGLVPVATATDGGGSARIPAAFCGLVGMKPTRGVVPRRAAPDWIDLSTDAPMATTVGDLRLLLSVMAGMEPGDPEAWPGTGVPSNVRPADGLPRRLLVAHRTADLGPLPEPVAEAFEAAAAAFVRLFPGALVERLHLARAGLDTGGDWYTLATTEHVSAFGRDWVVEHLDEMSPAAREFLGDGLEVGVDAYLAARRRRFRHVRVLDELLGRDGLLLTPTVAVDSVLADGRLSLDASPGALPSHVYSTELQNLTGHPAVSLPAGRCGPLPFGLQVTGPRYADGWLLDVAETWERAHPWPRHPPAYRAFAIA